MLMQKSFFKACWSQGGGFFYLNTHFMFFFLPDTVSPKITTIIAHIWRVFFAAKSISNQHFSPKHRFFYPII